MEVIGWSPNLTPGRAEEAGVTYTATKEELFKRSDLRGVFDVIQFTKPDKERWESQIFNRYFPPPHAQLPEKTQNYRQCQYYISWTGFMSKHAGPEAEIIRLKFKERFNKLTWLPRITCDRIWSTKIDETLAFRPTGQDRVPAPQLVINPHTHVRDLVVSPPAEVRTRDEVRHRQGTAGRGRRGEEESE